MKIFAIRDEAEHKRDLAWLLYYEGAKKFYIELPEDADPWQTPLLLSSFAKRGERSVNSYWSELWVRQRIIPSDRQNIGQILKEHHLKEYDEYGLLMLSMGRCAQDDYYLAPITEESLPPEILKRFEQRIEDLVPLEKNRLLVFFRDGSVKKCDLTAMFEKESDYAILTKQPAYFRNVQLQPGGHGIQWSDRLTVSDHELYAMGVAVPLTLEDFRSFVAERIVNAQEAAELLGCSRQYINELVKSCKLQPVKVSEKSTLFWKSDLLKRLWQG